MNVRDRIRAAEALGGAQPSGANRGPRLKLETGEHIKEEVLRRGDGGWSKKVGIGTQQKFVPGDLPPLIKLTTDTPVAMKPSKTLPKKLDKSIPGAFESDAGGSSDRAWSRVERMEAEQQARMDAEAAAARAAAASFETDQERVERMEAEQQAEMDAQAAKATSKSKQGRKAQKASKDNGPRASVRSMNEKTSSRSIPVPRFSGIADRVSESSRSRESSPAQRHRSSRTPGNLLDDDDDDDDGLAYGEVPSPLPREKVLFDPVKASEKIARRAERHENRRQARRERLVVETENRQRAREKSPSIRLVRVDDPGDDIPRPKNRHRSRSRSTSRYTYEERHSPTTHRSSFLWPSFSTSTRRSSGSIFEPSLRPKSSHARVNSDSYSTVDSTVSEVSMKRLEFAEYIAGKRLTYLPNSPTKPPSKPMGFVRSKSHTGEYIEGFTRDKAMLRRPDDDEVIEIVDRDWERRSSHRDRRGSHTRSRNEPWQVRLMQDIVRR